MVNALKKNFSPVLAGKYGKSKKLSIQRHHHANRDISSLEAQRVRALEEYRSSQSKTKLVGEKRHETHFLSNEEKERWMEDFVD